MTQPPEPPDSGDDPGGWTGQPSHDPYGFGGPSGHGGHAGPHRPPQGATYGYGHPGPGAFTTNGKATASLVVGISSLVLSWCCGFGIVGVVAIALGVKARNEIRSSQGTQQGEGLALAGIATGVTAVLLGLLVLVLIVVALAAGTSFDSTTTYGTEL